MMLLKEDRDDILAWDTGRRRLFEHMRDQGEQVETLRESGKTIRHLTREEVSSYLKQEGKVLFFKIKQEMMRQDIKQNRNHDRTPPSRMATRHP